MDQVDPAALAVLLLWTTKPTDRALTGWGQPLWSGRRVSHQRAIVRNLVDAHNSMFSAMVTIDATLTD